MYIYIHTYPCIYIYIYTHVIIHIHDIHLSISVCNTYAIFSLFGSMGNVVNLSLQALPSRMGNASWSSIPLFLIMAISIPDGLMTIHPCGKNKGIV